MKKLLFSILAVAGLCLSATSCWKENIPEAGVARHQVTDLKGIPGDEEAQLSWTMPEGWNPTEYIVSYTDGDAKQVHVTEQSYHAEGLTNNTTYTFEVQAVYGDIISGAVSVAIKPVTSRIAVSDLAAAGGDGMVVLEWSKPALGVTSYTLTYYKDGAEAEAKSVTLDADAVTYVVEDLENDVNYVFSLVANYPKGASDPAVVKGMPALAVPYFVSRTSAAVNQPIEFSFNREGYPTAKNVKWTFPDGSVMDGDKVSCGITSTGAKKVTLSVDLGGKTKEWTIDVNVREYVVEFKDWKQSGSSSNGCKGSCPVFSPDGKTVYEITYSKKTCLYAFDIETGELKWTYEPTAVAPSYNMLTVNPMTGDIYFGTTTSGQFYCVSADGNLKWKFGELGSMQSTAPAVNKDGSLVFAGDKTGNLAALNAASGSKKWMIALDAAVAGLLVNGDELVAGTTNGTISFISIADGTVTKTLKFTGMTDNSGFAVAADKKTVYVPVKTALGSFSLETKEILVASFPVAGENVYEPVVAPNGNVYVGSKDSKVYCVDKNLTQKVWSYTYLADKNAFNFSHPCVDSENRLYITAGQVLNVSFIFNPDGTVYDKWSYGTSANQKQMGGNNFLDGVLYSAFVGATGDNGVFYGKYVGGERASGWSTHGGDICGSCCVK